MTSTSTSDRSSRSSAPLVVLFLRGGMDGLSLLRPTGDSELDRLRGPLAVAAGSTVDVGDGFGLHPSMARTAARFADGGVAFVAACGLPGASRSHFDAQFAVEHADDPSSRAPTEGPSGWLGRHLAATAGSAVAPFRGVSLGQPQVPAILAGSPDVVAARAIPDLALGPAMPARRGRRGDRRGRPDAATTAAAAVSIETLRSLWLDDTGPLGPSAAAAFDVLEKVTDLPPRADAAAPPRSEEEREKTGNGAEGEPGADERGASADPGVAELVELFGSDLGTEVAVLNLGGWDDHNDLGATDGAFATRAATLDATIDALITGIPDVTVLAVSEFGRRVATNDSGGCDHGRGGVALVAGTRVRGGIHGDWPGLADLDEGDVRTANDVRGVFAEVIDSVLGGDPERIVPGAPADQLSLFR